MRLWITRWGAYNEALLPAEQHVWQGSTCQAMVLKIIA